MNRWLTYRLALAAVVSASCFHRSGTHEDPGGSDASSSADPSASSQTTGPPQPQCGDGVPDDPTPCPGEPGVIAAGGPTVITVADLDGDGIAEVIGNGPAIYRPLQKKVSLNPTPVPATSIAVLDMDGDGHLDVVTANDGDPCASRWPGEGGGALGDAEQIWCEVAPRAVAVARRGGSDVLVAGHEMGVSMQGPDGPAPLPLEGPSLPVSGLCPGKLTGAADDDIVGLADAPNNGLLLWRANLAGGLDPGRHVATGAVARECLLVDLDDDGARDMLLTPGLRWIAGAQLDTATPEVRTLEPARDGAAASDWDGDDDADLLVWKDGVPGLELWIRGPADATAPPFSLLETIEVQDARLGDVTGDGFPDVVAAAGPLGLVWVPQAP